MCLAHSAYHVFITHNLSRTIYIGVSRSEHDKWRLLTHENTERRKVIHQTWCASLQFCFTVHHVNICTGLFCCGHISNSSDPSYQHGLTLAPRWKSNHMSSKVYGDINYPFPKFNGEAVEVLVWISNFISHFVMDTITYPSRYLS